MRFCLAKFLREFIELRQLRLGKPEAHRPGVLFGLFDFGHPGDGDDRLAHARVHDPEHRRFQHLVRAQDGVAAAFGEEPGSLLLVSITLP